MGIDANGAAFLAMARHAGVDFTTTLTLGRQSMFVDARSLDRAVRPFRPVDRDRTVAMSRPAQSYADEFMRYLGARELVALDASDFEGAEVIHDLNSPVPSDWHLRYTLVVDGGTTEHVFNFPVALENAMRMVADDGHLVVIVPANQQLGHGLYQLSPELYFRTLCADNGFRIRCCLLRESGLRSRWLRVQDPAERGYRLQHAGLGPTDLFVLAQRVGDTGELRIGQQSDYESAWSRGGAPAVGATGPGSGWRGRVARRLGPSATVRVAGTRSLLSAWRGSGMQTVDLADIGDELIARRT